MAPPTDGSAKYEILVFNALQNASGPVTDVEKQRPNRCIIGDAGTCSGYSVVMYGSIGRMPLMTAGLELGFAG